MLFFNSLFVFKKDLDSFVVDDIYIIRELAPILGGSGSRRRYLRKCTRVDRVSVVFVARVDRRIFLLFAKNGFVVGARSLKTAGH